MRLPLFVMLRATKDRATSHLSSELHDVIHSPILTLHRLYELCLSQWQFYWERTSGTDAINDVVERVTRGRIVRYEELRSIRERVAKKIHDHPAQIARYMRNHCERATCGGDYPNGLYLNGEYVQFGYDAKIIEIKKAPMVSCRWCKKKFYPKFDASKFDSYFCSSRDCIRLNYESSRYQSSGGVDLTPKQFRSVPRRHWDDQRVVNYLTKVLHEHKRRKDGASRAIQRRAARSAVR